MGGKAARGLVMAAVMALLAAPAAAFGQHSKLALESTGPAGGNGAFPADIVGNADSGDQAFISTPEALTAGDTDSSFDLYSHSGGTTTLLSTGNPGGNGAYGATFSRVTTSGTRVFLETNEKLTTADTDDSLDVYMREGTTTTLISTGPGAGSFGAYDSYFAGASADGSRVFFTTRGSLVGADSDQSLDLYERSGGTTTKLSTGPTGGNGAKGAEFAGATPDGTHVYFETGEQLVAADTDSRQDVYERSAGTTTLVSTGPNGGNGDWTAQFDGVTDDGSKVFFHTFESLVSADTDQQPDIYQRSGGSTSILTIGPGGGNGGFAAIFEGASADGSKVWFETQEKLVTPQDNDSFNDVYQYSSGAVTQLTPGGNDTVAANAYFVGASTDGSKVFIRTEEPLAAGDTDRYQDIYQYSGGSLTRLSIGPAGGNGPAHAFFGGASGDGSHVFFQTLESLVSSDTDTSTDVYERANGTTSQLSTGPNGGNGAFDATFRAISADGDRVFFRTAESLLAGDTDSVADVYSANVPGTITVNLDAVPNDPQDFNFQAMLDDGLHPFVLDDDSDALLSNQQVFSNVAPGTGYSVSQAAAAGWDITSATCDDGSAVTSISVSAGENVTCTFTDTRQPIVTGYPRPKGATPIRFSLVPAYQGCASPNRTHGPALEFPSCNPPVRESPLLTVGTPDANGAPANFIGSVRWETVVGNPSTPADEADVKLTVDVIDVRQSSGLADYTGELDGEVTLRDTDRDGGVPVTVQDVPFSFAVPCVATASSTIGGTCALSTTADALMPGAVKETQRTIWQLGQMVLNDGGADGQAATTPNAPFARQGVFVP